MSEELETCIEPYLTAFEQTYAADEEGVSLHCLEEVLLRLTEAFAKLIAGA